MKLLIKDLNMETWKINSGKGLFLSHKILGSTLDMIMMEICSAQ